LPDDNVALNEIITGVTVARVNDELRRTFRVPDEIDGLVVTEIADNSPFREKFRPGMVILQIDRMPAADVAAIREHLKPGIHFCYVWNRGGFRYITFKYGD
jgi:hypothetical protein